MNDITNTSEGGKRVPDAAEGALVEQPISMGKAPADTEGRQKLAKEELSAKRKKRIIWAAAVAALLLGFLLIGTGFAFAWFSSTSSLMQTTQESAYSSSEDQSNAKDKDDAGSPDNSDASKDAAKAAGEEAQSADKDTSDETASSSSDANAPDVSSTGTESSVNSGNAAVESAPSPEVVPSAPASITVSVYVDSSEAVGHGWPASMASATVTLTQGASVYDALCATGVSVGGSSSYVSSISGLAEYSCGPRSGWHYYVNGISPGFGCGSYILQGGESITWHYVLEG